MAYHEEGAGSPLICLPGGPMLASGYLGDLGGLAANHRVVRLDLRGTGLSEKPADRSTYRCDRQVDDVGALRAHLGLDRFDLLGHSAGGTLAILYAIRFPDRVDRLVLVSPSPRAVGLDIADEDRREVAELRRAEPWFPEAYAAFQRIWSGEATAADWVTTLPFTCGRWDAAAQANAELPKNEEGAAGYYSDGAFDPATVREALAHLDRDVLLTAGEYDVAVPPRRAAEYARLFPRSEFAVQPGGGHFPWLDDPEWLAARVTEFLA